jgi:hypothetical protein
VIFPDQSVRIVISTKPVGFRKGHDGLSWMPVPGKTTTPIGMQSSIWSLRLMQAVTAQAPLFATAKWGNGRACKTPETTMREVVWPAARRGGKCRRVRPAVKVIDLDCFGRPIRPMEPLPMEDTARRLKGEARPHAAERTPQVECRRFDQPLAADRGSDQCSAAMVG